MSKCLLHLHLEHLHLLLFSAGDDEVVDQSNVASAAPPAHHRLIHALLEAHLLECGVELRIPGARCLAQAI